MNRDGKVPVFELVLPREIGPLSAEDRISIDTKVHYGGGDALRSQLSDQILSPLGQEREEPVRVRAIFIVAEKADS